jgi:DDE superfamily endonuclease
VQIADRPEHLLRGQDAAAIGAVAHRRSDYCGDRVGARGQLRRLRHPESARRVAPAGPSSGPLHRSAPDAHGRAPRQHAGEGPTDQPCPGPAPTPASTWSNERSPRPARTSCKLPTSPTAAPSPAGSTPPSSSTSTPGGWSAGSFEVTAHRPRARRTGDGQPDPPARRPGPGRAGSPPGYEGERATLTIPIKHRAGHRLTADQRTVNLLHAAIRAPAERGNSLLRTTFKALRQVSLCPWRRHHRRCP